MFITKVWGVISRCGSAISSCEELLHSFCKNPFLDPTMENPIRHVTKSTVNQESSTTISHVTSYKHQKLPWLGGK